MTAPGRELSFSAEASTDPDGDQLTFRWRIYQEAGTYPGRVLGRDADSPVASLTVPTGARNHQVHLVLKVRDRHPEVPLTDYGRVVLDVSGHEPWSRSPQGRGDLSPTLRPYSIGSPRLRESYQLVMEPSGRR